MRRRVRPSSWLVVLFSVTALAAGAAADRENGEVDDGLDVYFRDVDLVALSDQDLPTYPEAEAGESITLGRAFPDAPPQIPHSVEDMLPISATDNECIDCHHPDNVASEADRPIPKSHFVRPVMRKGKKGEPMATIVAGYKEGENLSGARYNCIMCHTPQATNVDTPRSSFVVLER
jgi:cytochrome c-type protein NapB